MKRKFLPKAFSIFLAFILTFGLMPVAVFASDTEIHIVAQVEGLESMFVGVPVDARVLFTLEHARFAAEIFPQDFWVANLPGGLSASQPVRLSDQQVEIRITGSPNYAITVNRTLNLPATIHPRNLRPGQATAMIPVDRRNTLIRGVTRSATVHPISVTFDLNPYGTQHRGFTANLHDAGLRFGNLRFGGVNLREDHDFTRDELHPNIFTVNTSFLARLPIGSWEIHFIMNQGANPSIEINVIDTSIPAELPPPLPTAPAPVPPITPVHPDENFMYLTGGIAVNLGALRWDLSRARVTPQFDDGVAEITVRANVMDNLAYTHPDETLEIITPMVRIRIPTNIVSAMVGGREVIWENGDYRTDLRITVIDRTDNPVLMTMFDTLYPDGDLLTDIVELRVELTDSITDEVLFSALEFMTPFQMTFIVMDNAGHLRPAGVSFQRAWLEFVPYRVASPNQIVLTSIFPGIKSVMHNRIHFQDIYSMHWGFLQSYTAAYSGIVAPLAHLDPEIPITRGEFAQLLAVALQLPRVNAHTSGFVDVLPPNPFFDGVSRLFHAGLLGPYMPDARFSPNTIITREEIAAIMGIAVQIMNPVTEPDYRPLFGFYDAYRFSAHNWNNVQAAVHYGVMVGYPDNTFRPYLPATRMYALQGIIRLAHILGVL